MDINNPTEPCIYSYTTLSAKHAINDKLQGSVATYLRRGGIVNNHIKKDLLLSLRVNEFFKIGEHSAKLQARTRLSLALSSSFSNVLAKRAKCMRQPRSCL